jgi:hypothetical protein
VVTASQDPLGPDALTWLRQQYRARQLASVASRPATRRMRQDPADRGGSTCDHVPRCRTISDHLERALADGRTGAAARGP